MHCLYRKRPFLLKYRSSSSFIILFICVSIFTDNFYFGAVIPVLPFALKQRAGIPDKDAPFWTSILFVVHGLGNLIGSPLFGLLADRLASRKPIWVLGGVFLIAGTIFLSLARSLVLIGVGRFLGGLATAVVYTVGYALLADSGPPPTLGFRMGMATLSTSIGLLLSPALAGIVYDKAGYQAVWIMFGGLVVLDTIGRLLIIEQSVARQWDSSIFPAAPATDPSRLESGTTSLSSLELKTTNSTDLSSPTSSVHKSPVPSPSPTEKQKNKPPQRSSLLTLLLSPRILSATYACFVGSTIQSAFAAILPTYVHQIFEWTARGAGFIFVPLLLPSLTAPLVGHVVGHWWGTRWPGTGFFSWAVVPMMLLRLVTHKALDQKALLSALLVLTGFGVDSGLTVATVEVAATAGAMEASHREIFGAKTTSFYAQAYGIFNCAYASGGLFGPSVGALVLNHMGWTVVTGGMAVLSASAVVPALLFFGGIYWNRHRSARTAQRHNLGV